MNSISVSVTQNLLVDIYLLLDKINKTLTLLKFNPNDVSNQNLSNSNYHIGYRNAECETGSDIITWGE
jgi:hypothetical protein